MNTNSAPASAPVSLFARADLDAFALARRHGWSVAMDRVKVDGALRRPRTDVERKLAADYVMVPGDVDTFLRLSPSARASLRAWWAAPEGGWGETAQAWRQYREIAGAWVDGAYVIPLDEEQASGALRTLGIQGHPSRAARAVG